MRASFTICLFFLAFLSVGCTKHSTEEESRQLATRAMTKSDVPLDSTFLVTQSDIECYAQHQLLADESKRLLRILPVKYLDLPVAFVVEYEEGWEIISADRRGPLLLADCGTGHYDFSKYPDAAQEWLNALFQNIADRWSLKETGSIEKEEEEQTLLFWELLTSPKTSDTRFNPSAPIYTWELISTDIYVEEYEAVNHLCTTLWHQYPPYNTACPLVSSSGTERAVAGCGPVAAAQYLYYLHNYWGVPVFAPPSVYCNDILPNQTIHSSGPVSTAIWSYMNNGSTTSNKAYNLIADIGMRNDTQYGETKSSSFFYNTVNALEDYGIYGDHGPYQKDTIISYLDRDLPILMRAGSSDGGHAFLVDGFVKYRTRYVDTYMVSPVDPAGNGPVMEPWTEQIVYYSAPYTHLIKMNWGWGYGEWHETGYALTGTWNASGFSFDRNFKMMYNVSTHE